MSKDADLARASAEASAARAEFLALLGQAKARLNPAHLRDEALATLHEKRDRLSRSAAHMLEDNKVRVSGVLALVMLSPLRKPIIGLGWRAAKGMIKRWATQRLKAKPVDEGARPRKTLASRATSLLTSRRNKH
jgi:hypothetical protein